MHNAYVINDSDLLDFTIVTTDRRLADDLSARLSASSGSEIDVVEKRGLDGTVAEWIATGGIATGALKTVLDFVIRYIELRKVEFISVCGTEIRNPRPQDVDRLLDCTEERTGGHDEH
jgi:hypothetical protein